MSRGLRVCALPAAVRLVCGSREDLGREERGAAKRGAGAWVQICGMHAMVGHVGYGEYASLLSLVPRVLPCGSIDHRGLPYPTCPSTPIDAQHGGGWWKNGESCQHLLHMSGCSFAVCYDMLLTGYVLCSVPSEKAALLNCCLL